jgi:golgi apparatus protein 1
VSEQQADDVKLDRQLFIACAADLNKLCTNIPSGSGQAYKCLMNHRLDRLMSRAVSHILIENQKIISIFINTLVRRAVGKETKAH